MSKLSLIYVLLLSLNVLVLLVTWYYNTLSRPLKILCVIFLSTIALEVTSEALLKKHDNNLFLYHVHNPIEYSLYALLFYNIIVTRSRWFILLSIPLFIIIAVLLSAYVQDFTINNDYQVILESVLIITYALIYFKEISIYHIEVAIERLPLFWITIGTLIYFSSKLFLEGFLNHLLRMGTAIAANYYMFSLFFAYIMCLMCLIGLYMNLKCKPSTL